MLSFKLHTRIGEQDLLLPVAGHIVFTTVAGQGWLAGPKPSLDASRNVASPSLAIKPQHSRIAAPNAWVDELSYWPGRARWQHHAMHLGSRFHPEDHHARREDVTSRFAATAATRVQLSTNVGVAA